MEKEFNRNTIDPTSLFQIENVADDNACLYRALANGMNYRTKYSKKFKEKTDKLIKILFRKDNKIFNKNYKNIYNTEEWGFDGDLQDIIAREVQKRVVNWLYTNKNNIYENMGITYGNLIEMEHELDIEEYKIHYSHFAGDDILVIDKDKNSYELPERWGGIPEQIALSNILEMPIIIYTSQKYNIKKSKIITGKFRNNKAEKGVRFKLYQIIGKQFIKNPPLLLLWKPSVKGPHYYTLYQKNKNIRIDTNTISL